MSAWARRFLHGGLGLLHAAWTFFMVILGLPAGPCSNSRPDHVLHFLGRLFGPEEYCMVGWAFLKLHGLSEWAALSH
ncbi:hypothetical protein AXF42_Ash009244 [Apostasia shenzhenica]|uniref:Uncharacterized protein n=1 Tax=Apostasia shenzhenica TaxID=1088818 RepID=A0A2I0B3J5_9ASPA|nr:hypothetical protein AXF42_Ash009244 [Apostasia shenzhenica]